MASTLNSNRPTGWVVRHDAAAARHDQAAQFWGERGDAERSTLQRELASYERQGADWEWRWVALIERRDERAA
jgi:hypothetical protein